MMKWKPTVSNLKIRWHSLRAHYHHTLMEGCLDYKLREKIQKKITYHETKLLHYINHQTSS